MLGRRRRDERGAIALIAGVVAMALVVMAGFTVDLGMQRVLRRDMQTLADVVALDLARNLDGRVRSAYQNAALDAQRDASVERNRRTVLDDDPRVTYELGTVDAAGAFTTAQPTEAPTAVRVTASGNVSFAFHGGDGGATRTAIAAADPHGCFSIGTFSIRANLGDAWLLGWLLDILGTNVKLDVLDIKGLAALDLDLLYLVGADADALSFDEVLNAKVGLADFYLLVAKALERQSGRIAEVDLLNKLAQLNLPHLDLTLGDLLEVDTARAAAVGAKVNLLDLVTAAAFIANGENVVAIPNLGVDLGITKLQASLHVGQKPIITCGPVGTTAESSQIEIRITGNLLKINLGVVSVDGPLSIVIKLAAAEGTITRLECTPGARAVQVESSNGLLDIDIDLLLKLVLLPDVFGGITLLNAPVGVHTVRSSPPATINLPVPDDDKPGPVVETGQHTLGVPKLAIDTSGLKLLGIPLGVITDSIVSPLLSLVLNPLIATLDKFLLSPLLDLLGVNVAGADYQARPPIDCGQPRLVG